MCGCPQVAEPVALFYILKKYKNLFLIISHPYSTGLILSLYDKDKTVFKPVLIKRIQFIRLRTKVLIFRSSRSVSESCRMLIRQMINGRKFSILLMQRTPSLRVQRTCTRPRRVKTAVRTLCFSSLKMMIF